MTTYVRIVRPGWPPRLSARERIRRVAVEIGWLLRTAGLVMLLVCAVFWGVLLGALMLADMFGWL